MEQKSGNTCISRMKEWEGAKRNGWKWPSIKAKSQNTRTKRSSPKQKTGHIGLEIRLALYLVATLEARNQ